MCLCHLQVHIQIIMSHRPSNACSKYYWLLLYEDFLGEPDPSAIDCFAPLAHSSISRASNTVQSHQDLVLLTRPSHPFIHDPPVGTLNSISGLLLLCLYHLTARDEGLISTSYVRVLRERSGGLWILLLMVGFVLFEGDGSCSVRWRLWGLLVKKN